MSLTILKQLRSKHTKVKKKRIKELKGKRMLMRHYKTIANLRSKPPFQIDKITDGDIIIINENTVLIWLQLVERLPYLTGCKKKKKKLLAGRIKQQDNAKHVHIAGEKTLLVKQIDNVLQINNKNDV